MKIYTVVETQGSDSIDDIPWVASYVTLAAAKAAVDSLIEDLYSDAQDVTCWWTLSFGDVLQHLKTINDYGIQFCITETDLLGD